MKIWIKLAFFGLLLIASSKDDTTFTEERQKDDATVTEVTQEEQFSSKSRPIENSDILRFKTDEDLKEYIAAYNDKDLLDEARSMYDETGYVSLLLIYDMNQDELDRIGMDSKNVLQLASYDDMLHLLLNRKGEIEIAEYTMRVDEDFVFKYKNGNRKSISAFLAEYTKGRVEIVKGQTVDYNEVLTVHMQNNHESFEKDVDKRRVTIHDYFTGGQYRMKSKQFHGYWLFYSSIGAYTKVQQKRRWWFFGWRYYWRTVKRYNRLQYKLSYKETYPNGFPTTFSSANGYKYCHCHIARKVYSWSAGVPAPIIFSPVAGSGKTVHWAHEFSVSPNTEHRTINY